MNIRRYTHIYRSVSRQMWIFVLLCVLCRTVIAEDNVVFMGSLVNPGTSTDTLYVAPAPAKITVIEFEDYIPSLSIDPGTSCTLGAALVKSFGFVPTIQLIYGEPLVVPFNTVIASKVWEFTDLDYDVQTKTPFIYDSLLDPDWIPINLNDGDAILLLTILQCDGSATVVYAGEITWK